MKIALLVDQFFRRSGVGRYTRRLVSHLITQRSDIEYTLLYPGHGGANQIQHAYPELSVINIGDRRLIYPCWHLLGRPKLERLMGSVDLVHVLSGSVHVPTDFPLVHTIHDLASWRRPQDYPLRRAMFKRKMLLKLAPNPRANFISISDATRTDLIELLDISPGVIHVVPNGLDHDRFQVLPDEAAKQIRSSLALPPLFFLFVGMPSPRKNIRAILRAFEPLADTRLKGVSLVFAGASPDKFRKEICRSVGRSIEESRTRVLGYVSDEELTSLYGAALALVFPSHYEGFGLPLIEAMACGCPVITSNVSALPEIADDAALLVPPNDTTAIGEAMCRMAASPGLRLELRQRGFDRASEFSWERTARETAAVYSWAIDEHD